MGYRITEVRVLDKKRSMVYLDSGEQLPLYQGELRRFQIESGTVLSDTDYEELMLSLKKRVRLRCLHLLQKADRTEIQLREKLKEGHYPLFLIEDALEYAKSFHYVDDARFARMYVEQYGTKRSRRQLKQDLLRRGVSAEQIEQALAEEEIDEDAAVRKLAQKKAAVLRPQSDADWLKVSRYLAGKGFGYETIHRTVNSLRRESQAQTEN